MKYFLLGRPVLSVIVFALQLTRTLASFNSTLHHLENDGNSTLHHLENDANRTISGIENEFDKAKDEFYKLVASEATKELDKINGTIAQFSMGYSRTPPISTSLKTSHVQSEVTVGLYDASGDYPQPEAFDFAKSQYGQWDQPWFGVALDSFDAEIEVEVDLSDAANGNYTLSLLQLTASYDGIAVEVDFQLFMTAEAAVSMSFTTGLELSLKEPMGIMIPALDPILDISKSKGIGIDADNFQLKPIFNATIPKLEFSAMLALRTVFSVSVESVDVGALTLDLPAFDFSLDTLTGKTSDCKTPPPGTPSDQIYAELIHMQGSLDAILSYELLDGDFSGVIDKWTMWNMFDECYAFFPGIGTLGAVPPSSKDSVLTARPVTTCTINGHTTVGAAVQSLDRGEKAAIAVGTFITASLLAALAFCGGRASQRRSIRNHGIATARSSEYARYGKMVDCSHYGEPTNEHSTPSMTALQTDDGSGLLPGDTLLQRQSTYSNWPRRKPLPYLSVYGVDVPLSTDLTSSGDIGVPTAGLMGSSHR